MKRYGWVIGLAVVCGAFFGVSIPPGTLAQKPVPKPAEMPVPPKVFATGRVVDPAKVDERRRQSVLVHGPALKALPTATATTWDCGQLGLVPPVVDQGNCGSCWDFSGTSICTSALIKAGLGKADGSFMLSEQFTLDCYRNGGCNGDDNTTVCDQAKTSGLPTTADYGSYQGRPGRCKSGVKLYRIQDWGFCTTSNQQGVAATQDIKNAMAQYGPIGSAIAADNAFMNVRPGQVFTGRSSNINHDIVLVGWDDAKGKSVGAETAWKLRNSWGTSWGDQGYCWIAAGANSVGTEAIWVVAEGSPAPPAAAPVITSIGSAAGAVGQAFSYQITATNTPTAFDATGLPPGLSADGKTGLVTGMPTQGGLFAGFMSAANSAGVDKKPLIVNVTGGPVPPTPPVPPAPVGTVTITLTPDQVTQVIQQSGSVVLSPGMTLPQLLDALDQLRKRPTTHEPPLRK